MSERKIGNNKEACKVYKAAGRLERNKKRNKARAEREQLAAEEKLMTRVKRGKRVPSRFLARLNGTSKGNMPNGQHLKQAA